VTKQQEKPNLEVLLSEFVAELNGLLILKCSHYFLDVGIKFVVNLRL
jgi:hypothetical protein